MGGVDPVFHACCLLETATNVFHIRLLPTKFAATRFRPLVKTVLVSQFKLGAARLTTAGMGASKPIDSNDTPQGRSQNRRVEFVRQ
jgi:hypothetical protein